MRWRLPALLFVTAGSVGYPGQPLHEILQLRRIEVRRCEPVNVDNVLEVSSFVRAPGRPDRARGDAAEIARGVPGVLIEGVTKRQSDVSFPFVDLRAVASFILLQKADCDTYPPEGICAIDHPVRPVDTELWTRYGE